MGLTPFFLGAIMKNFFLYVDREGKMPFSSSTRKEIKSHPFYVRYVSDRPVAYHGPKQILASNITNDKVYCYQRQEFVSIDSIPQE